MENAMSETITQDDVYDEVEQQQAEEGKVGVPKADPKDELYDSRALIPVTRGTTPANFAQMVDFARDMARARLTIPAHLQGNVGDCLAIVDIATRAGLSPYMVANKTYVEKGHIEFMSQLYHAFAQSSGLLRGD